MNRIEKIESDMERDFSACFILFCKTELERSTLRTALATAYLTGVSDTFKDPSLGLSFKNERVI
jgi:hypothetical protein